MLLLQGGGALGAYQAGVYEGLHEHGIEPTWVTGISIGAVNSAIIAGNAAADRVSKLRSFWELVAGFGEGDWWTELFEGEIARRWLNLGAAGVALTHGAPGFFAPRPLPPFLAADRSGATSWYDVSPLRSTLERLVDFDRINARDLRFSVGAVNVRTGNFAYFDNENEAIRPEHVMASGALPPAFAPVEIEGEFYWDGGMVSNTPLDWVLSAPTSLDSLIFQVDLWSARGELPRDLREVGVRMKEIQFSSRTRAATAGFRQVQQYRAAFNELFQQLPEELRQSSAAKLLSAASDPAVFNIVQLIYRSPTYEGQSKDYEFSPRTMEEHWAAGRRDAIETLRHPEVLQVPAGAHAVSVYDFTAPGDAVGAGQTGKARLQ